MTTKKHSKKKMSDIAKIAGVSESTVSRALNDNPLINEKTRDRIQKIAAEHNYAINRQAQNLRLQSSQTISVIIPIEHEPKQHVSDPFFLELLGSIADALTESQYDLLLSRVDKKNWRQKIARNNYVDGVIIIGQSDLHEEINAYVQDSNLPVVVWGAKQPNQNYTTVGSDNFIGGKLATNHLIERGRRRILFVGDKKLPEVDGRYQGYCAALDTAKIPLDASRYIKCGFTRENTINAMQALLDQKIPFDGVVAASDVIASSVVGLLTKAGYKIPLDCAVVGYDDIEFAAHVSPALTTVSQNIYQGGQAIVSAIFAQINNHPTTSIVLAPQLVIRETS